MSKKLISLKDIMKKNNLSNDNKIKFIDLLTDEDIQKLRSFHRKIRENR